MNILPALRTGQLIVIYGPDAACQESMTLIAELGLRGPVTILDGGNRYKPNQVANLLGRKTLDITPAANQLFGRRAFTCYEMKTLLWSTPPRPYPCIILDLLQTFYDDHTPLDEVHRILKSCLGQIQRLQVAAPVVITIAPPLVEQRAFLIDEVCDRADQVFTFATTESPICQLTLF